MKHLYYIFSVLIIILAGCAKDDPQTSTELATSWKETDYFASIGSNTPSWQKTETGKEEIIQFKPNNEFSSSQRINLNRYIMQPIDAASANLRLYKEGGTDTLHWIINNITPNTMEISFGNCIEGCGKRFVRL